MGHHVEKGHLLILSMGHHVEKGHLQTKKGRLKKSNRDGIGLLGHSFGTVPKGEPDVSAGDTILGRKSPIGTQFRDSTNSPNPGYISHFEKFALFNRQ